MEVVLIAANARVKGDLNIIFFQQPVQQIVGQENMVNLILMESLFVIVAKIPAVIVFLLHLASPV